MSAAKGGVWKMLTITDAGGEGGQPNADIADKGGEGGWANADNH